MRKEKVKHSRETQDNEQNGDGIHKDLSRQAEDGTAVEVPHRAEETDPPIIVDGFGQRDALKPTVGRGCHVEEGASHHDQTVASEGEVGIALIARGKDHGLPRIVWSRASIQPKLPHGPQLPIAGLRQSTDVAMVDAVRQTDIGIRHLLPQRVGTPNPGISVDEHAVAYAQRAAQQTLIPIFIAK